MCGKGGLDSRRRLLLSARAVDEAAVMQLGKKSTNIGVVQGFTVAYRSPRWPQNNLSFQEIAWLKTDRHHITWKYASP